MFAKLSEEEKAAAWKIAVCVAEIGTSPAGEFGQRVDACPVCSHVDLTTHHWPEAFSCECGAVIRGPDGKERVWHS